MDYEHAHAIMEKHGFKVRGGTGIVTTHDPERKKLKTETWLIRDAVKVEDGPDRVEYVLKYFKTHILRFTPNYVVVASGDWFGRSTHDRLNEYMPKGFRIWGTTYRQLKFQHPLGFLKTPTGVYPYRTSPMAFRYDGMPEGEAGEIGLSYCSNASEVVLKIPAYVDLYLYQLLNKLPCTYEEAAILTRVSDAGYKSRLFAAFIKDSVTVRDWLSTLGPVGSLSSTIWEDLTYAEVGTVLAARGYEFFKKPATQDAKSRRLEDVLAAGTAIPDIPRATLKKYLRLFLMHSLIEHLGFDTVEWSRR